MTNRLTQALKVLFLSALAGRIVADESSYAPPATPPAHHDSSIDWSQTHLIPEPALKEQFNRTKAFLGDKAGEVNGQVSRLKTDGILDRRTATRIRSALDKALALISRIGDGLQEKDQVDGWTARMYAYDLGMAADTLSEQAEKIETNLQAAIGAGDALQEERSPELEQQRQLARTLMDTGGLLRGTAREITENLK